jgi:hypothetical protein
MRRTLRWDYQHTDLLPDQPPQGVVRLAIGGDSRNDESGISFYPVIGNHEVLFMGIARLPDTRAKVKKFKESFLKLSVNHAPGEDQVAYSVDVENRVHFIALDNVSLKSVGSHQNNWIGSKRI